MQHKLHITGLNCFLQKTNLKSSIFSMTIIYFPFISLGFCFGFKSERSTPPGRQQVAALDWHYARNTIPTIASVAHDLLDKG